MPTIAERLQILRGDKSRRSFAEILGIPPSTLKNYEQGDTSPLLETLELVCEKMCISRRWLMLGEGPMRHDDATEPHTQAPQAAPIEQVEQPACPRCAKLEQKLELVEQERREIAQENRQLWKENKDLSVENAVLKASSKKQADNIDYQPSDRVA